MIELFSYIGQKTPIGLEASLGLIKIKNIKEDSYVYILDELLEIEKYILIVFQQLIDTIRLGNLLAIVFSISYNKK